MLHHHSPVCITAHPKFRYTIAKTRDGEPYIRILPVYCSRSLARQYIILQYAALIYCNNCNCNMHVVHIAIHCNILIYRNILYIATIYCILQQYVAYCNNISYIAIYIHLLSLKRFFFLVINISVSPVVHIAMKMDGFEKLEIDPNPKKL